MDLSQREEKSAEEKILLAKSAECSSCRQGTTVRVRENWDRRVFLEEDSSHHHDVAQGLEQVSTVRCTSCLKSLGIFADGTFYSLEDIFSHQTKDTNGWFKIETEWDRRVLFTLSQIIYRDYEQPDESLMEVDFSFPPPTDLVKLLWVNRQPVGFYSVKLKGTFDLETMSCYTMSTLDTLFIRKAQRGKGFSSSAIQDLLTDFPDDQNIGFSYPISIPMARVLKKHLELTPSDRPRFWELTGCGSESNIRNLWFMFNQKTKALVKK